MASMVKKVEQAGSSLQGDESAVEDQSEETVADAGIPESQVSVGDVMYAMQVITRWVYESDMKYQQVLGELYGRMRDLERRQEEFEKLQKWQGKLQPKPEEYAVGVGDSSGEVKTESATSDENVSVSNTSEGVFAIDDDVAELKPENDEPELF